ncbi:calcium release-activated calcium channel protein 1 [Plakobranchus ocellatus]|uniref:Calcium release-activated calcium channel protein 1 n=1 Tax=Plakobranchus ocellatus TaxID=259542 RepID=A0AAV4D105_9GAST|nr:calcium release-activated calcium channel protein 1 [Plakobranchus ocellatus]
MISQSHSSTALTWRRLYLSRAKLKASSRTSALLSGFAMVAMVEVSIDDEIPEALLVIFALCTTLLVVVHLVALMISTCILPNIEAVSSGPQTPSSDLDCNESPHDELRVCVEMAWICSTGLGIILFLSEIAILCWVKFYKMSKPSAIAATAVVVPAGILFIAFSLIFYQKLMAHKYQRHSDTLRELDKLASELHPQSDHVNII